MMHSALTIRRVSALKGEVTVDGAKNAVLPIMAACLLTDEPSVIHGVPQVTDVKVMADLLRRLDVLVTTHGDSLKIQPQATLGTVTPYDLVSKMRASICVLGPLLAKRGKARVSMPGGCVIGSRPVDLHIKGLENLGATIQVKHGDIIARGGRSLTGATIPLAGAFGSSVLATANVMMAATLAKGTTVIEYAACEPEVVDLANFLIEMGARIDGHGTSRVTIEGVKKLHGVKYTIISDRIQAGTLMMAAAITRGDVLIRGAQIQHLAMVVDKLREAGVEVNEESDGVRVRAEGPLRGVDVTTLPYPGFPTDLQAPMMALMSVAEGVSVITEKVYPERFMHISELSRMGASISREGSSSVVKGVERLSGAPVQGSDLRATAALVIAGLVAYDETEVTGLEHLDRGYRSLEDQLQQVGANITRLSAERREKAAKPKKRSQKKKSSSKKVIS